MNERKSSVDGGDVSDQADIDDFLDVAGAKHAESSLPDSHNI